MLQRGIKPPLLSSLLCLGNAGSKAIDHVKRNLTINVIGLDSSLLAQLLDLNRMESVPICFWPQWLYWARLDRERVAREEEGRDGGAQCHNRGKIWKAVQDIHQVTSFRIIPNLYAPEECEKPWNLCVRVFFLFPHHWYISLFCVSPLRLFLERAQG